MTRTLNEDYRSGWIDAVTVIRFKIELLDLQSVMPKDWHDAMKNVLRTIEATSAPRHVR